MATCSNLKNAQEFYLKIVHTTQLHYIACTRVCTIVCQIICVHYSSFPDNVCDLRPEEQALFYPQKMKGDARKTKEDGGYNCRNNVIGPLEW